MKKTSVRELHIHTSELVREAAEGRVIVIERRGEPVAELRPIIRSTGHARNNALVSRRSREALVKIRPE